jgi:hypothetical protein
MSARDGRWRSLPLLRESCSDLSVSPSGAHLCFDQHRYIDGAHAGRSLIFGSLDEQLAFVERRRVDVSQHEFSSVALDDDGGAVWFARGALGGLTADGAVRVGALDGWSHVGVYAVPFAKVPRELEHGNGARAVRSRDGRWLAANDLRNVVSVLFATKDFSELKALPKLQTVADFSRDGALAAVRSKKQIELRDVASWKKRAVIEHAASAYAIFSPLGRRIALIRDAHPQVVLFDVATGAKLAECPESVFVRSPAWIRDDVIVFNNGVLELPMGEGERDEQRS